MSEAPTPVAQRLLDASVVTAAGQLPLGALRLAPAITAVTLAGPTTGPQTTDTSRDELRRRPRIQRIEMPWIRCPSTLPLPAPTAVMQLEGPQSRAIAVLRREDRGHDAAHLGTSAALTRHFRCRDRATTAAIATCPQRSSGALEKGPSEPHAGRRQEYEDAGTDPLDQPSVQLRCLVHQCGPQLVGAGHRPGFSPLDQVVPAAVEPVAAVAARQVLDGGDLDLLGGERSKVVIEDVRVVVRMT